MRITYHPEYTSISKEGFLSQELGVYLFYTMVELNLLFKK